MIVITVLRKFLRLICRLYRFVKKKDRWFKIKQSMLYLGGMNKRGEWVDRLGRVATLKVNKYGHEVREISYRD